MQVKTVAQMWEERWHMNIFKAYTFTDEKGAYCRAAVIAQAQYVMARALKI